MHIEPIHPTGVELTFPPLDHEDFLLSARVLMPNGSWEPANLAAIRATKQLKALCLFLVLASEWGEKGVENGILSFTAGSHDSSWIKTLAAMRKGLRKSTLRYLLDDLHLKGPFWKASRPDEDSEHLHPHISLYTTIEAVTKEKRWPFPRMTVLPLKNLKLQRKFSTKIEPLKRDSLRELALSLEKDPAWTHKTVGDIHREIDKPKPTPASCIQETIDPNSAPNPFPQLADERPQSSAVPMPLILSRRDYTLKEFARELFFHIRRDGGEEQACSLLADYKSLCNQPLSAYGDFPLLSAISFKRSRVVDRLLEIRDIDLNKCDDMGVTPLLQAAQFNDLKLIERLLPLAAPEAPSVVSLN